MPEKNNGRWSNRLAVQQAFDADPQRAYAEVEAILTDQQIAAFEAALCPPPTPEEQIEKLQEARDTLVALDLDTADVDAKIAALQGQ